MPQHIVPRPTLDIDVLRPGLVPLHRSIAPSKEEPGTRIRETGRAGISFAKIAGSTAGLLTPTLTSPWEGEGFGVVGEARPCPWQSRTPSLFRGRVGVGVERR